MNDSPLRNGLNGDVRTHQLRRFTLPQICTCGAEGRITFEPRRPAEPDEPDPDPAIVAAEGPFQIDDGEALICLNCGARAAPRAA